eukprot:GHVN01013244.1.p2 GENE.GHVN01013244.1~~GHVN01013244.1.p2  ORF type:complete len:202 (-),score=31.10 GHVN01013244.1:1749-2354(-)
MTIEIKKALEAGLTSLPSTIVLPTSPCSSEPLQPERTDTNSFSLPSSGFQPPKTSMDYPQNQPPTLPPSPPTGFSSRGGGDLGNSTDFGGIPYDQSPSSLSFSRAYESTLFDEGPTGCFPPESSQSAAPRAPLPAPPPSSGHSYDTAGYEGNPTPQIREQRSPKNVNDALKQAQYAVSAISFNDIDVAVQHLKKALNILGE